MLSDPACDSPYVAPLSINKSPVDSINHYPQQPPSDHKLLRQQPAAAADPLPLTPPATPMESHGNSSAVPATMAPPMFHCFLRATFHFDPSCAQMDTSISLTFNEGDLVLVHSIHTNGWADGTLLASGARGWLPTNYCSVYDAAEMKNLLMALLNFWDLLRSPAVDDIEIFGNQEFMKGIIAGVRYLLERTNCLTKEATIIQANDAIRRGRKYILSELSNLVKTAKLLQEVLQEKPPAPDKVNKAVDKMLLNAFKIVTKGSRFLDAVEEVLKSRDPAANVSIMPTVAEEADQLTPPADQPIRVQQVGNAPTAPTRSAADLNDPVHQVFEYPTEESLSSLQSVDTITQAAIAPPLRTSTLYSPASPSSHRFSLSFGNGNRRASVISHRLSMAGPSPLSTPQNLVSERLYKCHDEFLSHLSAFIGRLHLQSQSCRDISRAIQQSAASGGELLFVIDAVCANNVHGAELLSYARNTILGRIQQLVIAGERIGRNSHDADVIMPHDNSLLRTAATGCVKAAGDCVAKTKWVMERIGDFEVTDEFTDGPPIHVTDLDAAMLHQQPHVGGGDGGGSARSDSTTAAYRHSFSASSTPPSRHPQVPQNPQYPQHPDHSLHSNYPYHPHHHHHHSAPHTGVVVDKPLPKVPEDHAESDNSAAGQRQAPGSLDVDVPPFATSASLVSVRPTLPPLPRLSTSLITGQEFGTPDQPSSARGHGSFTYESITASSSGSASTYLSRDSESSLLSQTSSLLSQTSTRATTPDNHGRNHTLDHRTAAISRSQSSTTGTGNGMTFSDEVDEVESSLMEKTFAHELIFNKEGQVTAGSLPALVERLTTHQSTPDPTFVRTFYLTFRLFCSPLAFAQALVDRFEHVRESGNIAGPVRLRVSNAFKIWLESYWRDEIDRKALTIIVPFAEVSLSASIPSAGRRLLELARRVSSESIVPRFLSTIGKAAGSFPAQYIPADTPPPPPPYITRSQLHALANWKQGGSSPSLLDLDPLELARQLTIKQMGIFCSIVPEELLASQWTKKGGADAPNVKAMSSLSTDLSNLVAETILQFSDVKKRAAVIKQWIKIAHCCFQLHNYDGLMAILCSLNSSTIDRLRKTWDAVSPKRREMLRTLQAIVEPCQNKKILRTRLNDHVPPCLPFLGMYLTDLTFVDVGNQAMKQLPASSGLVEQRDDNADADAGTEIKLINFDKHSRTARIIFEMQRFQSPYRLAPVPEIQEWMAAQIARVHDNNHGNMQVSYYRTSLELEPREVSARTPVDAPSGGVVQRPDIFAWMRDRGSGTTTPPQVSR